MEISEAKVRLDRIEAAIVGAIGLLLGMQTTHAISQSWQSIANEKKAALTQAVLDVLALQKEVQQGEAKVDVETMAGQATSDIQQDQFD